MLETVKRLLTPATAPMSASAPNPMLNRVGTPLPLETVPTKSTRNPARKLWAVTDRRGVVVATSPMPTVQETAATHAAVFLEWLGEQEGLTGQPVLYDLVGRLYVEAFCPALDFQPFPWRAVAKALDALPAVRRYVQHVDTERGRTKKHVYVLPDARAAVVEFRRGHASGLSCVTA